MVGKGLTWTAMVGKGLTWTAKVGTGIVGCCNLRHTSRNNSQGYAKS